MADSVVSDLLRRNAELEGYLREREVEAARLIGRIAELKSQIGKLSAAPLLSRTTYHGCEVVTLDFGDRSLGKRSGKVVGLRWSKSPGDFYLYFRVHVPFGGANEPALGDAVSIIRDAPDAIWLEVRGSGGHRCVKVWSITGDPPWRA